MILRTLLHRHFRCAATGAAAAEMGVAHAESIAVRLSGRLKIRDSSRRPG